jgi:hypothetical protein
VLTIEEGAVRLGERIEEKVRRTPIWRSVRILRDYCHLGVPLIKASGNGQIANVYPIEGAFLALAWNR